MNLSSVRTNCHSSQRKTAKSCRAIQILKDACDEFIELRRAYHIGQGQLVGAHATIGENPAIVLIQSVRRWNAKALVDVGCIGKENGQTRHFIDLANRLKRPLLVCIAESRNYSVVNNEPADLLNLPKHMLAQWGLDVPIILLIFTGKISVNIFTFWLADKVVSFDQTRFLITPPDYDYFEIRASSLVKRGVIDKTVLPCSSARSIKFASLRLRNVLLQTLNEATFGSRNKRRIHREHRLARVEAMIVKLCGQSK